MNTPADRHALTFHVLRQRGSVPINVHNQAYLEEDRWDDWGKFRTQFRLTIADAHGVQHQIGDLKIGMVGLEQHRATANVPPGHRWPDVPRQFSALGEMFFSVGQGEDYYEELAALGDPVRESVLRSLRDIAFDETLWEKVRNEHVMGESLLRSVSESTVEGQYRRMARGGARLTQYGFSYSPPKRMGDGAPPFELEFSVAPELIPPTNVHVLIGRNGVGKTRILSLMTKALVAPDNAARQSGTFKWSQSSSGTNRFANLVTVSFSAFDDTELLPEGSASGDGPKYSYIGLRRRAEEDKAPKTPDMLDTEFVKGLAACQVEPLRRRWLGGMNSLMADPVFRSACLRDLMSRDLGDPEQKDEVKNTFSRLSSGHKIVVLTLTRLVQTVEEKTLVLIDELEAHLHPPLLSAFVRTLSQLLADRNGVAIVATHSPVVLQEVPKTCVWVLTRVRHQAKVERPSIETFGENVGILTREVFQLELSQSGFHDLLRESASRDASYAAAVEHFDGQLGAEARAVLKAMFLESQRPGT